LHFLATVAEPTKTQIGQVGDYPLSVRALAYIMAGHVRHHLNVLRESYGIGAGA
jgi:hypothetical protein